MLEKLFKKVGKNSVLRCLAISDIVPNPRQPRRDFDRSELDALTESIKTVGLLQPIAVRRRENIPELEINGVTVNAPTYEIIAGERRWRACKRLGFSVIPCLVCETDENKAQLLALVENMQRKDLDIFEQAEAIADIITQTGITQTELARQLSVTQSCLANKLRILKLSALERAEITAAGFGERHARAFLRITEPSERICIIRRAADRALSAAETERMIDAFLKPKCCEEAKTPKRIGAISDIRFFYNTIDRAIVTLGESGIKASYSKTELGGETEITIRIKAPQGKTLVAPAKAKSV